MFSKAQVPMLRLLLPFVSGVIMAIYANLYSIVLLAIALVLIVVFIGLINIKTFYGYKYNWINGIIIYLLAGLLGYTYTVNRTSFNNADYFSKVEIYKQGLILGEVLESPSIRPHSTKLFLDVVGVRNLNEWKIASGKIALYIKTDSLSRKIQAGDKISFLPKFEDIPSPKNPNEFDYRQYMAFHLIQKQAFLQTNEWKLIRYNSGNALKRFAGSLRSKLINIFIENGIKGNQLAVASALVLGYKDEIDAQLKRAYSSSGAMHVLAVSGLHVGIIFLIVSKLFYFIENKKYVKYIKLFFLLGILWFYALITGLSPSVLRAATMFSFIAIAEATSRNTSFFNTLATSAFFLLLVNPFIIMEVGFQLSYLAVIGIVVFYPWFYAVFIFKNKIINYVWSITSVSLAAQLVTFPLSLLYFHQFPNYFLLSNLVVIPMATIILPAGLLLFFISPFKWLASYFAFGFNYALKFLNEFVLYVEKMPNALMQNIPFSIFETWMLYLFLFFLICFGWYKRYAYIFSALCCLVLCLTCRIYLSDTYKNQSKFIVYNIPKYTAINFIQNTQNIVITDFELYKNKEKMLFHVQNNWIKHGLENEKVLYASMLEKKHQLSNIYKLLETGVYINGNFIGFNGKRLFILNKELPPVYPNKPIAVDYIVVTSKGRLDFRNLKKYFSYKKIILDTSVSKRKAEYIKSMLSKTEIHDVNMQGYFMAEV
jgi:competence protein ComEC